MPIEDLLKVSKKIARSVRDGFGLSRHDLLILLCSRSGRESLTTLEREHGLKRGLNIKRLRVLEEREFIERTARGRRRTILLTDRALEVIRITEERGAEVR